MLNEQNDFKTRLAQILDKQKLAAKSQRHINPNIVSWVSNELHPAFNTLKKLLEDERGVDEISITNITSSGETLEFEVRGVFNSACIQYAVKLIDSQGKTDEVKFTVNNNEAYSPTRNNINVLDWGQNDIINDFLTALEKWNG